LNGRVQHLDGRSYQARFDTLAAAGEDVHGEASFVMGLAPADVLDAGCGTGRVAIELARRGVRVAGVDVDASMIAEARRLAPELDWAHADVAGLDLGRRFDVVLMAGNVPLFCHPEHRGALVASCARHLCAGGALVSGFQLGRGYGLEDYDAACRDAGLGLEARYSTWDSRAFAPGGDYAVSVHRRPSARGPGAPRSRHRTGASST
jgi:SAM-dependent methyltransferase